MKSNEEWSSQLWSQFLQLRKEAWKKFRTSTGLEPVTSRIPVRRSTNWGPLHMSPVDRAGPVSEISAHPLIPLKKSRRVHMRERAGSVAEISVFPTGISESGLKVAIWTETNFISVTEPARLTGLIWRGPELWSHWRWEQVNCGFICSRERYVNEWCIWNKSYVNCGYEIKWRMILAVVIAIFTIA